jgi:hypothetical protein
MSLQGQLADEQVCAFIQAFDPSPAFSASGGIYRELLIVSQPLPSPAPFPPPLPPGEQREGERLKAELLIVSQPLPSPAPFPPPLPPGEQREGERLKAELKALRLAFRILYLFLLHACSVFSFSCRCSFPAYPVASEGRRVKGVLRRKGRWVGRKVSKSNICGGMHLEGRAAAGSF